jgi:hypothetical protein
MNELTKRIETVDAAALSAGKTPSFRPAHSRRLCNAQLALPIVQRRPLCRSLRSVRAAMRAAEMAEWQATGGDYLCSELAPLFIQPGISRAF